MRLDHGRELLQGPLELIHFGLAAVTEGTRAAGAVVTEVEFAPPAGGDPQRVARLDALRRRPLADGIAAANREVLRRILASAPHLVGVGVAREVIPGMTEDLFLHAGPPITWERASGPLKGAIVGGLLLERRAASPEAAEELARSGAVRLEPCHAHSAVGPMAGLITPSMPVWVVEDRGERAGARVFCTLNEGLGKVLRYGAYTPEVLERLRFMAEVLAPTLAETLARHGPVDLKLLMAQALHMGDEGHNRNRAATSLLLRELAPALIRVERERDDLARALAFVHGNDHFFLNLSMPMAKCMLAAAEGVERSSLLTVMARNGTDFGIQLAAMPGRWFVGPAQAVRGLYFPGFGPGDANPDIGDSAITETAGLGGFAMAAAPAIVQFVGGSAADALATTRSMGRICCGSNPAWTVPALDFAPLPTGVDLLEVEEKNLLPVVNTGIAHRRPGVGQVGAGLVNPPWECFHAALEAFADHCRS